MAKTLNPVCRVVLLVTLMLTAPATLIGQSTSYSYFYRVYFRDKNGTQNYSPGELFSERAIARREKNRVQMSTRDLPVSPSYLNAVSAAGFTLHCTSRWMNTGLFKTTEPADISILLSLPFVRDVRIVKNPVTAKSAFVDKLDLNLSQDNFPPFDTPVSMLNGFYLHDAGYTGKNILIAVLDGGFFNADKISSLNHVRDRDGIRATYDFVEKNDNVYDTHDHGTAVLSILAGLIPGYLAGSAPGADFLLLKTEDVRSEFPVEEDLWAAGAEYADSAGADIITSSLGYFNFDDPSMDYSLGELDGNTAFVTQVADVAASRGILVVNSAGNERDNTWMKIIFPSDGDSVLAAGAVDGDNIISYFSSEGYSSDGRVKPDNVAMGVSVPVQTLPGYIARGNGTSFSCPVLSGMAACLMQSQQNATPFEIIEVFHSSADRYTNPDPLYGYGLPDMKKAFESLQDKYVIKPENEVIVFPNPTSGDVDIVFKENQDNISLEIFTVTGKLIFRKNYDTFMGRRLPLDELQLREQGIYFLRIIYNQGTSVIRIIKLRN